MSLSGTRWSWLFIPCTATSFTYLCCLCVFCLDYSKMKSPLVPPIPVSKLICMKHLCVLQLGDVYIFTKQLCENIKCHILRITAIHSLMLINKVYCRPGAGILPSTLYQLTCISCLISTDFLLRTLKSVFKLHHMRPCSLALSSGVSHTKCRISSGCPTFTNKV